MKNDIINICQVSLDSNISLIKENFFGFKKIYKKIRIYILCPEKQLNKFREKLPFEEIKIINENDIISYDNFVKIFENFSQNIDYKKDFKKRLNWYYQQILKISFALSFIQNNNENLIIWDADTVILKKIPFFNNNKSIIYGNFFEFHKKYYVTNKLILKSLPNYFISFLNQFIAITPEEGILFIKNYLNDNHENRNLSVKISELVLKSIFEAHKSYEGSLFSEYELMGQSNYKFNRVRQKPILFLRFGLNGKLTKLQIIIAKILGYKHCTYEHTRNNIDLKMLERNQSWKGFLNILFKNFFNYYPRYIKHIILHNFKKLK